MSGRNFVATVKEGEVETTPWITVEMHEDGGFGSSHVQLRFRKGTSLEEVKATAKRLNQDVEGFLLKPN